MPRKPAPPLDDPEQSRRFTEMARKLEPADDSEAFEKAFKKVTRRKSEPPKRQDQG